MNRCYEVLNNYGETFVLQNIVSHIFQVTIIMPYGRITGAPAHLINLINTDHCPLQSSDAVLCFCARLTKRVFRYRYTVFMSRTHGLCNANVRSGSAI